MVYAPELEAGTMIASGGPNLVENAPPRGHEGHGDRRGDPNFG